MNNFLVLVRRNDRAKWPDGDHLEPYLVRSPSTTDEWSTNNGRVRILSFQVCTQTARTNLFFDDQTALTFDGFPFLPDASDAANGDHGRTLLEGLREGSWRQDGSLTGEFSLAFVDGGQVLVTCSLGGSHAVYYTVNQDFIAFSNRAPLLLALPSTADELSTDASSWLCYQGYIGGTLTPFKEIKKLPSGAIAKVDEDANLIIQIAKYRDILDPRIQELFSENPAVAFEETCWKMVDYLERFTAYYDSMPLHVRLSGGKDSRLVLALLLKAGLENTISSIMTRGPSYSPEVLAAQDVCKAIGYENHEIRRPAPNSITEISFQMIVNTINYTEGNLSLYDFMGIHPRKETSVCGHQLTLRPGAYKNCRQSSFEAFVEDATIARFHDPLSVLRGVYLERIQSDFAQTFCRYREEGAALTEFGDLHLLRDRLQNWAAVFNNADYYSGPLTNPLLLPEVLRFAFSMPAEARSLEMPHYVWMKFCDARLPGIPFADDAWKPRLFHKLSALGMSVDPGERTVIAYQSHGSFPDLANPLIPSLKLSYFHALRPVMRGLLKEQKDRVSEYLDVKRLDDLLTEHRDPTLGELYCTMGVYADLLLRAYGKALFRRSESSAVAEELRDRSKGALAHGTTVEEGNRQGVTDQHENALMQHELCVAALVRETQRIRDENAVKTRAQSHTPSQGAFDGHFVVKLPKKEIRQVRIDPMNERRGIIELSAVVLMTGPETRHIRFLEPGDYLNIINAEVLSTTDSQISFRAIGDNRPWLALKDLHNLDLSQGDSAELFVRMRTTRGCQITVYWDVGNGYNSEDCARINF